MKTRLTLLSLLAGAAAFAQAPNNGQFNNDRAPLFAQSPIVGTNPAPLRSFGRTNLFTGTNRFLTNGVAGFSNRFNNRVSALTNAVPPNATVPPNSGLPGELPTNPGTPPVQPGVRPQIPETPPGLPGNTPGLPGNTPGLPGTTPGLPGVQPALPGNTPGLPGNTPGLPGNEPGLPGGAPPPNTFTVPGRVTPATPPSVPPKVPLRPQPAPAPARR